MHLLFKYASRSRPEKFFEGIQNIRQYMTGDGYTIFCCLDEDDPTIGQYKHLLSQHHDKNVIADIGKSASKIDAINRPVDGIDWDVLVNYSDDMRFYLMGYDQLIREAMLRHYPDTDGLLHFPDTDAKEALPTMYIAGRKYFERDGYIYHPSYQSLWADNESMLVAQLRGKYTYIDNYMINHLHPAYGRQAWDDQYITQQKFWDQDEKNFVERFARKFDLPIDTIVQPQIWDDARTKYILI